LPELLSIIDFPVFVVAYAFNRVTRQSRNLDQTQALSLSWLSKAFIPVHFDRRQISVSLSLKR